MKRSKKVLMLASVASMIDQFNMQNIRLLQDMGYEVHVMCNFREGNTCDSRRVRTLQKTLQELHVPQHPWDCPRSVSSFYKCCMAYRQLKRLIHRHPFVWIHCHSPIGAALARVAAHQNRIPVIYTAHGFHFYKGAPIKNWLLYYPVEKLLAHWTDVLITVNQEDFNIAKRHLHAGKVCRIPGVGIDTRKFAFDVSGPDMEKNADAVKENVKKEKLYRRFGIPKDAVLLLSVGELNRGKNHQAVISAMAGLARQDVYYLICGQGPLQKKLQRHAQKLGVSGRIRMPGYQEHMVHIYPGADIFILPSKREGMPAALMEAMAAGLPCIVSDIRGSRELADIRFSLRRPGQLQDELALFIGSRQLREAYGKRNQEKIKDYDQMVVREKMRNIYAAVGTEGVNHNKDTGS